jgi:hypothetical protein
VALGHGNTIGDDNHDVALSRRILGDDIEV